MTRIKTFRGGNCEVSQKQKRVLYSHISIFSSIKVVDFNSFFHASLELEKNGVQIIKTCVQNRAKMDDFFDRRTARVFLWCVPYSPKEWAWRKSYRKISFVFHLPLLFSLVKLAELLQLHSKTDKKHCEVFTLRWWADSILSTWTQQIKMIKTRRNE